MPTYAYRCNNCGVEFERVQKFSDQPLTRCPECRGKVRRIPQASGIVFKGSGWYANDSKNSSSAASSSKKSETSTTESTATESASDKTSVKEKESKPADTKAKPAASDD
ncbi:MAG: FmdB family zinc ribbon protein [Anaerolineales bacterium]